MRNCTQLPKPLQEEIVLLTLAAILADEPPALSDGGVTLVHGASEPPQKRLKSQVDADDSREGSGTASIADGRPWRRGGAVPLGVLAGLVGKDRLVQLKSNCGGLKTLFKNHWQTFVGARMNVSMCFTALLSHTPHT